MSTWGEKHSYMKSVWWALHMLLVIDRVSLLPVQVMTQIAENGINLYALPDCDEDEDEDYREQCRLLKVSLAAKVVW